MVLGAAERLHALAVARARLVDVAGDGRAADEGHRGDTRVRQECVHRVGVAVHHVEHAVGHAGLLGQLGQEQRRGRVLLGRLEHEGIAARDGVGQHPEWDHHREVERV